jgi:uncharacterized protein GlcG (DUF336 family)
MKWPVTPAKAGARCIAAALAIAPAWVGAQSATFTVKQLTPETALKAAQAALAACRANGHQVAVAVVDRGGHAQVMLRDRFAGAHTVETAINKAWTAVSFRTHTTDLEKATRPGTSMAGIRGLTRATAIGGGLMVEAGGSMLGAIAVSGAPGGDADDTCARAGLKAIADDLEF